MPKARRYDSVTAVVLLLSAGVLRFWQLGDFPLFNDELSALTRTNFSTFGDLMRGGVMADTHPAFAQVFLWLWSPMADLGNGWLRLPFVLMGWGSVVVVWRFADMAMDRFRANLVAAVLAAGQLFVFNSEMARPYAPGMLFSALYVLSWYRWTVRGERSTKRLAWMTLWMALAAYTHYFALLTVAVVWLSGWLYCRRAEATNYLVHAGVAFLLFTPYLPIFFVQLGYGGLGGPGGWLNAPGAADVMEWFVEVFNFNVLLVSAALLSLVYGLTRLVIYPPGKGKLWALMLAWFGVVLAVGWVYSLTVSPVMHILTLVFVFPFVVVAVAWPWQVARAWLRAALPVFVLAVMVFSLFFQRRHYEVVSQQPFAFAADHLIDRPEAFTVFGANPVYIDYCLARRGKDLPPGDVNTYDDDSGPRARAAKLAGYKGRTYVSDGNNPLLDALALRRFPHVEAMVPGFTFTGWVFGAGSDNRADYFTPLATRQKPHEGEEEYFGLAEVKVDSIEISFANEVRTTVDFERPVPENIHLVFHLERGGETLHWSSAKPIAGAYENGRLIVVNNVLLWDVFGRREDMAGAVLKVFLWNPDLGKFKLLNSKTTLVKANPNRYGLLHRRP